VLVRKGIKIFLEKLKILKNYLHFLLKNDLIFGEATDFTQFLTALDFFYNIDVEQSILRGY